MYLLIRAVGKSVANSGRWESIEIGDVLISTTLKNYQKVKAILSNPFLPNKVTLELDDILSKLTAKEQTFNQFLAENGNKTLPTTDREFELKRKYVTYRDAFQAGYSVNAVHPTLSPDAELPTSEKPWLLLNRKDTDMQKFVDHVLVSVNGFFHFVDGNKDGAWVQDGMISKIISNYAQIGLYNFAKIGKIRCQKFKPEMFYKLKPEQRYCDRVYVKLDQDLTNQSIGLVLGGYLHLLDSNVLRRVGTNAISIEMSAIPLVERYHESMNYIDLSSLPFERTDLNKTQISIESFMSDEVIIKYLLLSQSFLVFIDNSDIFIEREEIDVNTLPGMAITYLKPEFPLQNGVGRMVEYWTVHDEGQWALTYSHGMRHNRVYDTVPYGKWDNVADSRITTDLCSNSLARFIKIGTDV